MIASYYGHLKTVKVLIDSGAKLNIQNNDGDTALMFASRRYNSAGVKELIDAGADPNIQNNNGDTALKIASDNGYEKTVKLLKEAMGKEKNPHSNEKLREICRIMVPDKINPNKKGCNL